LWVTIWDGKGLVYRRDQLDPLFIEICRRIRFEVGMDDRIGCLKSTNKSLIEGGFRGGITGDPWAPINIGDEKIFTINKHPRLGYRQCIDLMDGALFRPSPLQLVSGDDPEDGLAVYAAAMVRGPGKTAGYHERRITVSKAVKRLLSVGAADQIAAAGHARAELVGKLSYQVLQPALRCLLSNGKEVKRTTPKQPQSDPAKRWLDQLDRFADVEFFPALWQELEVFEETERERIRNTWLQDLIERAEAILGEACRAVPLASIHRYRARTRAKGRFRFLAKEQFPQLYAEETHAAADTSA
jgi:CRISPR system Cascade subunit CasA